MRPPFVNGNDVPLTKSPSPIVSSGCDRNRASDLISGFGRRDNVSCTKHLSRFGHDPVLAIVMPG
jgi:hypothetical protein